MLYTISQRTYDAIITSLLGQNDATTSFWRNDAVIIAARIHWAATIRLNNDHNVTKIWK